MVKLGNYKWMTCEKCGKRYTKVPGKESTHKCDKGSWKTRFFNMIKMK